MGLGGVCPLALLVVVRHVLDKGVVFQAALVARCFRGACVFVNNKLRFEKEEG